MAYWDEKRPIPVAKSLRPQLENFFFLPLLKVRRFLPENFISTPSQQHFLQAPQKHQKWVSHVLDLPMSKVVCKTKRIGGGFGGKETRSAVVAALACVPAYLLRRPVKLTLDRDTDMAITGQRHAFLGKYKVFPSHPKPFASALLFQFLPKINCGVIVLQP